MNRHLFDPPSHYQLTPASTRRRGMQARNGVGPVALVALLAVGCTELGERGSQQEAGGPPKLGGDLWTTSQKNGFVVTTNPQGIVEDQIPLPGAGPHITTFPPSGDYAYVGGMLDGKLYVIDADSHAIVTSLQVGPTLAHQA